jgi:AbrB family looped-hinge helix DNA binding protein
MKIDSSGQITIPKELRERFGLLPGMEVEVEVNANGLLIKPAKSHRDLVTKWLHDEHGGAMASLTTDQLMSLIGNSD